jgi:Tfp pilus assembly pilus retraction ATPase PilT
MTIENGFKDGHISFNRCLAEMYYAGTIDKDTAMHYSYDSEGLEHLIGE